MNYLLLTEDKNPAQLDAIMNSHFDGYTRFQGSGVWKGKPELNVTFLICDADPNHVQQAAEEIKAYNQQESVMILALPGEVTLL